MKKLITAIFFLFLHTYICSAQSDLNDPRLSRLEAIKVAFLTRELNLSPDEAQKFWPVYNNYFEELKKARKSNEKDELVLEEKVLTIRKKYKPDFVKVLNSEDRANKIFVIERNYRELLRKELMNRQKNMNKQKNNGNFY